MMLHGGVPVNVTEIKVLPLHNVPVPEIVAVGLGLIIKLVAVLHVGFVEQAAKYVNVPGVFVFTSPDPATPTGLKGLAELIDVPPVAVVYHWSAPPVAPKLIVAPNGPIKVHS